MLLRCKLQMLDASNDAVYCSDKLALRGGTTSAAKAVEKIP
jgi:hypothetical protein